MSFAEITGRTAIKKRLINEIKGSPCHASVFTGVKGSGKHLFAHEYAKALLCSSPTDDGACGVCPDCKYVEAKTHPDLIVLEPEKGARNIKVTEVREKIVSDIKICPQIAKRKIYVIEADALNEEGQNGLLKSLEEPPQDVMFIMICEDAKSLLPTVMSRTVEFKLTPCSREEMEEFLIEEDRKTNAGRSKEELRFIADFSSGIIGRAIELLHDDGFMKMRDEVMDIVLGIGKDTYTGVLVDRFAYFESNKDLIDDILLFILWTLGDLDVLLKDKDNKNIMNIDRKDKLLAFLNAYPNVGTKNISGASACVTTLRKRLDLSVNYNFAVRDMLLGLKKELQG